MQLYIASLDYCALPVEVCNVCHLSRTQLRNCLTSLVAIDGISKSSPQAHAVIDREMIILSTRSRLEVYFATSTAVADVAFSQWLLQIQCHLHDDITNHFTQLQGREAVRHLLRIASGMELPLLSEPYILEQMMAALTVAQEHGTAGPNLARLFQHATRIGRRIYAASNTGNRAIFFGHAATHFLDQCHPEIVGGNLLIVGSSKLAHLAAQVVQSREPQPTAFIDRTVAHAAAVKQNIPGQIFLWHQMRTALIWADVVVVAALAPHPILDVDDIGVVLRQRRGRPLLLIDLGISHNVHPVAAAMENVVYYDLEDLRAALADLIRPEVMRAESSRSLIASFPGLEQMIHEEVSTLYAWIEHAKVSNDPSRSMTTIDNRQPQDVSRQPIRGCYGCPC